MLIEYSLVCQKCLGIKQYIDNYTKINYNDFDNLKNILKKFKTYNNDELYRIFNTLSVL